MKTEFIQKTIETTISDSIKIITDFPRYLISVIVNGKTIKEIDFRFAPFTLKDYDVLIDHMRDGEGVKSLKI